MAYGDVKITVTWMDGTQEIYECYDARITDSVLVLNQRMHSGKPAVRIPLANVRIWEQHD